MAGSQLATSPATRHCEPAVLRISGNSLWLSVSPQSPTRFVPLAIIFELMAAT